jgi:Response regulators consisting of a CheY-like receiver domain and a winged-helix DNA-binding domain
MEISTIEILLIEDNSDESSLIAKIIENNESNINITRIENGLDAMGYLYKKEKYKHSKTPNLILLDLNLPKKDGREVLKEIKTDPKLKLIPVIVLTNSNDDNDVFESYGHYANAYLTKPTDFDKFNNDIMVFGEFWLNNATLPDCIG